MFLTLYKSFIRPHLEYASCIWAPYHKKGCIELENVQRCATKMVSKLKDLSYSERLRKIGLPSLEYRRKEQTLSKCTKFYKPSIMLIEQNSFLYLQSRIHEEISSKCSKIIQDCKYKKISSVTV